MTTQLGDDEFVGYTFTHAPPRRPRLWFLDRHLHPLILGVADHAVTHNDETGIWTVEYTPPPNPEDFPIPDIHLRYEHLGAESWIAVWRLTYTAIPHIHTFGRDDTWRLGVWPD